jgi:hypothetical protein
VLVTNNAMHVHVHRNAAPAWSPGPGKW